MAMIWNYINSWWKGSKKPFQVEPVTYRILTVTVLRAKTQKSRDIGSQSDLYVTLSLPTATATTRRTKTINNNNNPEWNETFTFRVPSQTKNVLEISVFDDDYFNDDEVATVFQDLGDLDLDSKLSKVFELDETDVLEMEFELKNSEDQSLEYVSNGILMGPPLSVLSVKVQKLESFYNSLFRLWPARTPDQERHLRKLKVKGAYKESQVLDKDQDQLQFLIQQDLDTELELTEEIEKQDKVLKSVPLQSLPPQHSTNIILDKELLGLQLNVRECAKEDLRVRLDEDIPPQEKEFIKKRKNVVAKALQTLLGLDSPLSDEQVPVIALVASGGGSRASTGFLGSLKGLKEMGVLDTVTYMSGVSGSTWTMSTLCQDERWSQNLETIISQNREQMTKNTTDAFWPNKIKYYRKEIEEKRKQGHLVSFIDKAGLVIEELVFGQKNTSTLSDQRKTVKHGQNPFPIYTAVNLKEYKQLQAEFEWVEFTPFEVGLQKYGAFVKAEDFGSEFFLGHLIKKLPEIKLPFLMGIWSSAFSVNAKSVLNFLADDKNEEENNDPLKPNLDTVVLNPESSFKSKMREVLQNRLAVSQTFNFTRGLTMHQEYSCNPNFVSWKESHPDALPNWLTPSDPTLQLIDSGLFINIACPPVLRPQRHVDILIVVSDSWETKNIFDVLKKTAEFCAERQIPFPKADYTQDPEQSLKEVYVFEDPEVPTAPIVLFLPLVNVSFKEYKEPGVPRETPEEVEEGNVDVSTSKSPYRTRNLTYNTKDYDALFNLSRYNVLTSQDTILSVIRNWIQGRN